MTNVVESTTFKNIGDGVTTEFPFSFPLYEGADLNLFKLRISTGVMTPITTNFLIYKNPDNTGYVKYPASGTPLSSSYALVGMRDTPKEQGVAFSNQTRFYSKVVEDSFDRLTAQVQEVAQRAKRGISSLTDQDLLLPNGQQSVLVIDTDGKFKVGLALADMQDVIDAAATASEAAAEAVAFGSAAVGAYEYEVALPEGTTTAITLPYTPVGPSAVDVYFNGVQQPRSSYVVADNLITPILPWPYNVDAVIRLSTRMAQQAQTGVIYYAARTSFVTWALTNTPTAGTIAFVEGYSYRYLGTGAYVSDLLAWEPFGQPHPKHWGCALDGITDDTEKLRAFHAYCNAKRLKAEYAGITSFACQIGALITVTTSVDFCGALAVPLNGIVATPSYGAMTQGMFVVNDSTTPLVTGTTAIADTNLAVGSHIPTSSFWTDPGYVYMACASTAAGPQISSRDRASTLVYRQTFAVLKEGMTNYGLATAMTGATNIYYEARRNTGKGWITIKGLVSDLSLWNNGILIDVQRNEVTVEDFESIASTGVPTSISRLIAVRNCAFVNVRNIRSPALTPYASNGTYVLLVDHCAEIRVDRLMGAVNGWGCIGGNDVNGFYITNSILNRFDCHDGGFNLHSSGNTYLEIGITYGWGGGDLTSTNDRCWNCALITARQDYGGYWFGGSWKINNPIIESELSVMAIAVDMLTNPVGCASIIVPMPRTIEIIGMNRRQVAETATSHYLCPILHAVDAGAIAAAKVPVAMEEVKISGVVGQHTAGGWTLRNQIDIENMSTAAIRTKIEIEGVEASRAPTTSDMGNGYYSLYVPAKTQAGTAASFDVKARDSSNLCFDFSAISTVPRVWIVGCEDLRRAKMKNASGRLHIKASTFSTPTLVGAETQAIVGGTRSGTTSFTELASVSFRELSASAGYDLSQVSLGSGLLWNPGYDAWVTLPGGVTQTNAMNGFRVGTGW